MKRYTCLLFSVLLAAGSILPVAAQSAAKAVDYSFQNLKLSDEKRVESVLRQLTLEEKINLLGTNLGVERLGIPACGMYEGLHGLALGGPAMMGGRHKDENGKEVADDKPTTVFPQAYGLGASWDPDLMQRIMNQESTEIRYYFQSHKARPSLITLAPNADLARDPRWGRTEESFGEDAFLTARMTVAAVKGLQGDNPRYWRVASLMKHFLANSNEDGRDSTSSDFDERLFHEYYSYPFYKGITEGGSRAFMASYNSWNGTPMCVHPVLNEVARKQWGNNGIICTDGGALSLLVNAHHAFKTMEEGAAAVVKATTGQFLDHYRPHIEKALEQGLVTEADIDNAIRGNIFVALKLGLLDGEKTTNPYRLIGTDSTLTAPFLTDEARQLAREATSRSAVLLKNNGLLPLQLNKIKRIALIGPYADKILGDWYGGTPAYQVTIRQALEEVCKEQGVELVYVPDNQMGRAEEAARQSDVAIVCVGNHPYGTKPDWKFCPVASDGREAVDRQSITLPEEEWIRRVYKVNPQTMMVLVSSFPYAINWSNDHLPAILHTTHCSQEQGHGIADVLLGKVNPAGRTTQTWVKDLTELPPMMDYNIHHGRTYMYQRHTPLYPFGYGLSYSQFSYSNIKDVKVKKDIVELSLDITNTSDRDGEEVVQLYAAYPESKVERPQKQLRAFQRVAIPAHQTQQVRLVIDKADLGYWDTTKKQFVIEPTAVDLLIGASSADIRQKAQIHL